MDLKILVHSMEDYERDEVFPTDRLQELSDAGHVPCPCSFFIACSLDHPLGKATIVQADFPVGNQDTCRDCHRCNRPFKSQL